MKRFRLLFILLSVIVLLPVAFLVSRAVRSAEIEAQMQHQAVAERVFDEMERALSQLLENEERRPVDSFLAAVEPSFSFVTGHFEIEPDGRIEVAAAPPGVDDTVQKRAGAESKSKDAVDLEQTLSSYWRGNAPVKEEARVRASQLPGTTLALGDRSHANVASNRFADKGSQEEEVSTLQALRSLNKGVAERDDRPAARAFEEALGRDTTVAAAEPAEIHGRVESAPPSRQQMIVRSVTEATPMSGRLMDAQQLLLVRTVVRAAQAYRQGAVIDLNALGRWLHDSSLGSNGLAARASVSFSTDGVSFPRGEEPAETSGIYVYQHRFAEPFDDLIARLALAPLPGGGNLTYVYALSALLLAAATCGLAAIYRMVAVVVTFAERRNNFVAAVSHELKTPLTAIRMYGEMLRDGIVPSEAKRGEYYRHITAESERLSRLIDNVLEFSRLEKGNRSVNLVSASVVPAVREAAELLRPHVESSGFRLIVECDEHVPPVRFERDALVQVLCNLGDNAVKYAADSTPRDIELRCRHENGTVLLTVRDHGPGVPQRHLGKIFEPFYRGENELTRRTKGTGLGLALVRSLCERMGGQVSGRNVAGGGFVVEIRLCS